MVTNLYEAVLRSIRRWFKVAWVPAEPVLIPVKVRINEAEQYQPMRIREYRALQSEAQTMSEPMKRTGGPVFVLSPAGRDETTISLLAPQIRRNLLIWR